MTNDYEHLVAKVRENMANKVPVTCYDHRGIAYTKYVRVSKGKITPIVESPKPEKREPVKSQSKRVKKLKETQSLSAKIKAEKATLFKGIKPDKPKPESVATVLFVVYRINAKNNMELVEKFAVGNTPESEVLQKAVKVYQDFLRNNPTTTTLLMKHIGKKKYLMKNSSL